MNGPELSFNSSWSNSDDYSSDSYCWAGAVFWSRPVSVRIRLFWAREAVRGLLAGDFGAPAGAREAELGVTLEGPIQAKLRRRSDGLELRLVAPEPARTDVRVLARWTDGRPAPDLVPQLLGLGELGELAGELIAGRAPIDALPKPFRMRLLELFPDWPGGVLPETMRSRLEVVAGLSERIWREALRALEQQASAAMAAVWSTNEPVTLFQGVLEPGAEAFARWERFLQGERSADLELDELAGGLTLPWTLPREWLVELHLPLLDRNQWKALLDGLRAMDARADELGRVLVDIVGAEEAAAERRNFQQAALLLCGALPGPASHECCRPTGVFCERRRLSAPQVRHLLTRVLERYGLGMPPEAAGDIDVNLSVGLSADAQPWLEAPRPRSPEYYAAFGEVSRTLQQALRVWAPYLYFADLERFEDAETALPMLVYQASRPASSKSPADFTYDVMNLESVHRALRTAGAALPELLRSAAALLEESGRQGTAARYRRLDPRAVIQAVKQRPRWFQSLLAADAAIVGEVIKLATATRVLRDEPAEAPRRLYRALEQFVSALHQRLRRLYGRFSVVPLGSLLLLEASRSLAAALGRPAAFRVSLQWRGAGAETWQSVSVSGGDGGRRV